MRTARLRCWRLREIDCNAFLSRQAGLSWERKWKTSQTDSERQKVKKAKSCLKSLPLGNKNQKSSKFPANTDTTGFFFIFY